jgi:tricorn protease
MKLRSLALSAILLSTLGQADPIKRATAPAVSPNGQEIVFSWQGDLWRVPIKGGRAERLTVHPASDTGPRWTPDGKQIVFSSNRYGSADLFVMDRDGGGIRRLTFESGSEAANAISPDGQYVIGVTNVYSGGRPDLFRVPLAGGEMVRLTEHPFETEFLASFSADGKRVYYNRGAYGATSWQKPGMKSSALPDIWVADNTVPLTNHRPLLNTEATEMYPLPAPDGTLYFLSNASGWPNIWKRAANGRDLKKLTSHSNGTVRNLSLSADGGTLVYEFDSDVFVLNTATGVTGKLSLDVPADQRVNPEAELAITSGPDAFDVSPDGKRMVLALRADLFLIPAGGGTTRRLTTNVGADEQPAWLDAKSIVYTRSDKGKRDLYTVDIDGNSKPFLTSPDKDLVHPTVSPDRKWVALHHGGEEIAVVPATGGTPKVVARGNFVGAARDDVAFSWSPDSKWLVIGMPTDRGTNVTAVEVETGKTVVVARAPRGTSNPRFLPNGKGIYFSGAENAEGDSGLFIVDLVPNAPEFSEDDLDKIDDKKEVKAPVVKVEIYEPGIEMRLRRLADARGDALASPDSKALWLNVAGVLTAVPVAGGPSTPVTAITGPASGLKLSNGKLNYVGTGGRLFAWTPGSPAASPVSFNAQYTLNLRDEEQALFDEIWWAMDRFYYDPGHNNKDWKGIKDRFAKVVPFCYDRADFYSLMGEMMEELDSSHLGATSPPPAATPGFGTESTGYLGVDFDPKLVAQGSYVVTKIYMGSAASNPGSLLKVGDRISAVDGQALSATNVLGQALNRKSGKRVSLTIQRDGKQESVLIKPDSAASRTSLFYEDFVSWQRAQVEKLSGGKLTYVHIRGMDEASYQRFLREIRTLTPGKKGVLIDVRYNGGGSTSHKLLGVLIKTPWLIRTTRGPEGIKLSENIYRGDSLELPTGLLFNSFSFSNAEIMGEGFRILKRGPSVGERTPGYVIGTGAFGLWDGGLIRMPAIGAYAVNGDNLENDGRRPDFTVPFDPNAWQSGRDPQIEKAVQELLKQIGG